MNDVIKRAKVFIKNPGRHLAQEFSLHEAVNLIQELIRLRAEERNKIAEIICQQGHWTTDELAVALSFE